MEYLKNLLERTSGIFQSSTSVFEVQIRDIICFFKFFLMLLLFYSIFFLRLEIEYLFSWLDLRKN